MKKDILEKLLIEAVNAPSGDNSQPWRFTFAGGSLSVYNVPHADNPIFNYKQWGSYMAHGALLENIALLSPKYGFEASIEVDVNEASNLVAKIVFTTTNNAPSKLSKRILERHTDRGAYRIEPVSNTELSELGAAASDPNLTLQFIVDKEQIKVLSNTVSAAEELMLQYRPLHRYFFSTIAWNTNAYMKVKSGLYVKTMNLMLPQLIVFRLYSIWGIAKVLNFLGMPKVVAKTNALAYEQCGGIVVFKATDYSKKGFISLGRQMQRVWLKATDMGLSVQPIAGALFLEKRLSLEGVQDVGSDLLRLIEHRLNGFRQVFGSGLDTVQMMFRIGYSLKPAVKSPKKLPNIELTT